MLAQDHVSFGGRSVPGFALGALETFAPGDVWQINFESNVPVTPDQFFALVGSFEAEFSDFMGRTGLSPGKILSFMPVDQQHFQATVQWSAAGNYNTEKKDSETVQGIKFTLTGAQPVSKSTSDFNLDNVTSESKKGLATAGITTAGAIILGGIVYAATRKPRRRTRR